MILSLFSRQMWFVGVISEDDFLHRTERERPVLAAQSGQSKKRAGRGLQIGRPAFSGKPDKLGVRLHARPGLYEIVIILNSLHAEIEI